MNGLTNNEKVLAYGIMFVFFVTMSYVIYAFYFKKKEGDECTVDEEEEVEGATEYQLDSKLKCVVKTCDESYELTDTNTCKSLETPDEFEDEPDDEPDDEDEQAEDEQTEDELEQPEERKCEDKCLDTNGVFDKAIPGCECLLAAIDEKTCQRDFDFVGCQPSIDIDTGAILEPPMGYIRMPDETGFSTCNANDFEFAGRGEDFDELAECRQVCQDRGVECKGFTLYNAGENKSCYIHTGDIVPEARVGAQCFKKLPPTSLRNPGCQNTYSYNNTKKGQCEPAKPNNCLDYTDEASCTGAIHDLDGDGTNDCQWLSDVNSCCVKESILCPVE